MCKYSPPIESYFDLMCGAILFRSQCVLSLGWPCQIAEETRIQQRLSPCLMTACKLSCRRYSICSRIIQVHMGILLPLPYILFLLFTKSVICIHLSNSLYFQGIMFMSIAIKESDFEFELHRIVTANGQQPI